MYSALHIHVSISFHGIIVVTPCRVVTILSRHFVVEGLVCPVIMEMLLLTSADLTKASFKMASGAIEAFLSFIVPCFISDTPDFLL